MSSFRDPMAASPSSRAAGCAEHAPSALRAGREGRSLVVFDFDGTLADTWRDIAEALNRTLREADLPLALGPEVRFWIGDGVRGLLARATPALREAEREQLFARFLEHYERCCLDTTQVYPGIARCVEALRGHALAVASNKPGRFLERVLVGLGMRPHFALVVGGDSLPVRKPDPEVLRHVMREIGDDALQTTWMIGDSGIDVATGRAAGVRTIGCAWGLRGADELREAGAEFMVEDPSEIPPLILYR